MQRKAGVGGLWNFCSGAAACIGNARGGFVSGCEGDVFTLQRVSSHTVKIALLMLGCLYKKNTALKIYFR